MNTITKSNGIVVLSAEENHMLKKDNVYVSEVWLGVNDSPDSWKEVDYVEYEAYLKLQNETAEEESEELTGYLEDLEEVKARVISDILEYDSSDAVNSFYTNGVQMWVDKATRVSLAYRLESEKAEDKKVTTLWWNSMPFSLPVADAISWLHKLENYASKCYDRTQSHIKAVKEMASAEDVSMYDYKSGYPEPLEVYI